MRLALKTAGGSQNAASVQVETLQAVYRLPGGTGQRVGDAGLKLMAGLN